MFTRKRRPVSTWALLSAFFLVSGFPSVGLSQTPSHPSEDILARFAQRLTDQVRDGAVGGITAGVVVGNDLVWAQGFGWADMEKGIPAGVNTVYRVGSISKSFTAVTLLQRCEKGLMELDNPVIGVLPELAQLNGPSEGSEQITFRQLASHTAGLAREPELPGAASGPMEGWEEKVLASIPTTSFLTRPGEAFSYSNIGFGILGYAISRASDTPFMELVAGSLLRPLGMTSSGFVVTPEISEHLAVGYQRNADGTVDRDTPALEHIGRGYKIPNGGIYSTVGDLGRFITGLTGAASAPILGSEGMSMIRVAQTPKGSPEEYSIGFRLWDSPGAPRLVGHGGSVSGYMAFLAFDPESGIGVILLSNYHPGTDLLKEPGLGLLRELVASSPL